MKRFPLALVALLPSLPAIACGRAADPIATSSQRSPASSTTAARAPADAPRTSRDLASVQMNARFAFHHAAGGYEAFGNRYTARVADDGSASIAAEQGRTLRLATAEDPGTRRRGVALSLPARDREGAMHVAHAGYDERFRNGANGIEQSWTFAARPSGGDVDLHISATGLPYVGTTENGLLFGEGAARLGYGNATWVDAAGRQSEIPATWSGHDIALHVPRALLDASAYPAVLDPLVGPEVAVGGAPVYGGTFGIQSTPAVGASAANFYVAWEDQRRVIVSANVQTSDLYGARLDPVTGLAVADDAAGVPLLHNVFLSNASPPIVASAGGDFLVLLQTIDVYQAVRVDGTTGLPLASDADGVTLAELPTAGSPSVASLGDVYIVTWAAGDAVWAQRIGRSGPPIDAAPVKIADAEDAVGQHMSCGDAVCLVTWTDSGASYFVRYDPATGLPVASDQSAPELFAAISSGNQISSVTYGSGTFLVTWGSQTSGSGAMLGAHLDPALGTFVTADGAGKPMLATNETPIAMTFDGARFVGEFMAASGTQRFVETWDATTLAEAGTSPIGVFYGATAESVVSLGTVGTRSLIVGAANDTILEVPFDDVARTDTGSLHDVVKTANVQYAPAVASNGAGAYVTWSDGRTTAGGLIAIYGARLDGSGNVVPDDAAGVLLGESATEEDASPAVISDGTDYVVTWTGYNLSTLATSFHAVRVSSTTGQVTATMTPFGGLGQNPEVLAYDGSHVMVATVSGTSAVALALDPMTLAVTTPPFSIPGVVGSGAIEYTHPAIAYGGSSFLLTWTVFSLLGDEPSQLAGARFTVDGTILDAPALLSTSPGSQQVTALAAAHGNYLLTWADQRDNPLLYSVYGRLIPVDGPLTANADFRVSASDDGTALLDTDIGPDVVDSGDGLSFAVVWCGDTALYSALVGYDGTVRDTRAMQLSDVTTEYAHARVAKVTAGQMIVAYSRNDPGGESGVFRVEARTLSTGSPAGSCTGAGDCASRICQDGYCCDKPCTGACETCAAPGKQGICSSVVSGTDPDSCSGGNVCTSSGACLAVVATACATAGECASGNCVDGVCCESACDGGCDVCNAPGSLGKCTVVAAGSTGASPSCIPYICDGSAHGCPSACAKDSDCVRPYLCGQDGKCELQNAAYCVDDETLKSPDGTTKSCAPYRCEKTACVTLCRSIEDCASGDLCDESGACVTPSAPTDASGCSVSRADPAENPASAGSWLIVLGLVAARGGARKKGRSRVRQGGS